MAKRYDFEKQDSVLRDRPDAWHCKQCAVDTDTHNHAAHNNQEEPMPFDVPPYNMDGTLPADVRGWERDARDAIGLADRLHDENVRLRNVLDEVLGLIRCGEGQRACQVIEQVRCDADPCPCPEADHRPIRWMGAWICGTCRTRHPTLQEAKVCCNKVSGDPDAG